MRLYVRTSLDTKYGPERPGASARGIRNTGRGPGMAVHSKPYRRIACVSRIEKCRLLGPGFGGTEKGDRAGLFSCGERSLDVPVIQSFASV